MPGVRGRRDPGRGGRCLLLVGGRYAGRCGVGNDSDRHRDSSIHAGAAWGPQQTTPAFHAAPSLPCKCSHRQPPSRSRWRRRATGWLSGGFAEPCRRSGIEDGIDTPPLSGGQASQSSWGQSRRREFLVSGTIGLTRAEIKGPEASLGYYRRPPKLFSCSPTRCFVASRSLRAHRAHPRTVESASRQASS